MLRHIRAGFRQLHRQPGLSAAVIVTLGIAIGANTAIFSFVNALLIRPFPFRDPEQLVQLSSVRGGQPGMLSMREVLDIREQSTAIESIAAHKIAAGGYNYSGDGRPAEWKAILTTGNLFEVLGVPLERGAKWPEATDRDRDYRVILTHQVWQTDFGGADSAVGRSITLDHATGYQIHGVTPRGFDYPRGVEVYRSIGGFASYDRRDARDVVAVARLKPGWNVARLQAEMDAISSRLASQFPETNAGMGFRAIGFRELYSGDVRSYLLVLLGAVAFVLLIACANIVNLLLSRALARDREMAVRIALGAGRRELILQLLAEMGILALLAAVAGTLLAFWWVAALRAIIGPELPTWMTIDLDFRVFVFTLSIALAATLISGLIPALQLSRPSLAESLKSGGRGSSGSRSANRMRELLIAGEIALAVMLVTAAGLLVRSFLTLQSSSKGFTAESVQTFRVALGWKRYTTQEQIIRYYERALDMLKSMPESQDAALGTAPPLTRQHEPPATVQREGQPLDEVRSNPYVHYQAVSEHYWELLGIPLRSGRVFTQFDRMGGDPVAVVSERLARVLWPNESAVGKRLRYNPSAASPGGYRTIVGVVGDVQQGDLGGEAGLDLYVPYRQVTAPNQYFLARTKVPPSAFRSRVEQVMWSIDAEQSVFDFQSYDERIAAGVWQLRLSRLLLVVFGGVALTLAALGVYAVMSYLVGQRIREMGIRLALGASPADIRMLIVSRALVLGSMGTAAGLLGATGLAHILQSVLPGSTRLDWVSLVVAASILAFVTIAASMVPAWRASRTDPATVLQAE